MIIHVVKLNETLPQIAEAYGVPIEILMRDNGITPNYPLAAGQALVIQTGVADTFMNPYTIINGYAYPNIDDRILKGELPSLTSITIFGYGFTKTGELIEPKDESLIKTSISFGVAPIMLIANLDENAGFSTKQLNYLLNDIEIQDILIENILNKMIEKRYMGLDVDFENIDPSNREAYLDFLRKITARLHEYGYTVNVDVIPKTSGDQTGILYEAYDYQTIGEIADTVLLMTYDWGYAYGPPMAISPIDKVRAVLDYAVTVIPREKILMGIPNYGYDWALPFAEGKSKAALLGNLQAVQLAASVGAEILYDETAQSPYFNYTDSVGRIHAVWFEDARSIQAKLELMKEYGLLGAGYWNLMPLFPQNWVILNSQVQVFKWNLQESWYT